MWAMFRAWRAATVAVVVCGAALAAQAQHRNVAPGFVGLPTQGKVLVAPIDVELFLMSAGGVLEPKADWTDSAQAHMKEALFQRFRGRSLEVLQLPPDKADELSELLNLHAAVARAISLHHNGALKLPTKEDRLDWSFGDVLHPLRDATGARYALFTWVRDSYASAERKAMMVGLALIGISVATGAQVGYATLVDLDSGRVLWFNQLARPTGDLREADKAAETVEVLLANFPATAP